MRRSEVIVCRCWVLYAPVQILSPTLLTSHDHISSALPTGHSKNIREQKYFVKCRCINIWSKSGVFIMLRRTWHSLLIQIFFTTAQWSVLSRSCQVISEGGSLWHEHCWVRNNIIMLRHDSVVVGVSHWSCSHHSSHETWESPAFLFDKTLHVIVSGPCSALMRQLLMIVLLETATLI